MTIPYRVSVPQWVTTVTNYGMLPRRIPGAAIAAAPVMPVEHVPPLTLRQRITQRFWRWVDRHLQIIEPDESFREWWHYEHYVARHTIRPTWVEWPTQWWPTLAVTARPADLIESIHLRKCSSEPECYDITVR